MKIYKVRTMLKDSNGNEMNHRETLHETMGGAVDKARENGRVHQVDNFYKSEPVTNYLASFDETLGMAIQSMARIEEIEIS